MDVIICKDDIVSAAGNFLNRLCAGFKLPTRKLEPGYPSLLRLHSTLAEGTLSVVN